MDVELLSGRGGWEWTWNYFLRNKHDVTRRSISWSVVCRPVSF